ncbi:hypothetical protein OH738_03565 [Streptomyces hirsutus]|uniref:Uncharacterized protein n=1 Tax=Streptomyces hirsutus TaxID=35620 RepID=A0ABZ1GYJ0_9ACTN|nr:hypothetical protein [Streptomyces hirsutus]WSD10661.1 hypothetical protein OIE73_36475 [Streptomyces hirsutus]WTD15993.1 hypothetical protein OH738_03565 [Streptomyces hirsutus]WTD73329.1 hypothetical protein OHB56_04860 [Streptomyces sp. NBC_01635]
MGDNASGPRLTVTVCDPSWMPRRSFSEQWLLEDVLGIREAVEDDRQGRRTQGVPDLLVLQRRFMS